MEALNRFIKGIRWFRDKSLIQGDEWVFPSSGIRLTDHDEEALSVTFIRGNTYKTGGGEEFILSEGFHAIGSITYNHIIYLISVNDTGVAEIGSYPSPACWTSINNSGFERVYRPFKNFKISSVDSDFRTPLFGFSTFHEIDIVVNETYDGSVNLYIADFNRPNIVINSGFNQFGERTGSSYDDGSFDGAINLIPTSVHYINPTLTAVSNGGVLGLGMYYLYFRYVDSDYNSTKFLGELFPVQVSYGEGFVDTEGGFEYDVNNSPVHTTKKIGLDMHASTLDHGFEFIEIIVLRYTENKDGSLKEDAYIIDKLYNISDLGATLWITGEENQIAYTVEELFQSSTTFSICKTQAIVESRYYGGNWKAINYDNDILIEISSRIKLSYSFSNVIQDTSLVTPPFQRVQHQVSKLTEGSASDNVTLDFTGHFRGEIYPFAVKYIMIDGTESEAFPVIGYNMYDAEVLNPTPNNKGLFCFPTYNSLYTDAKALEVNQRSKALAITFDITDAKAYYEQNKTVLTNVKAIVFLRGERIKNILYQGIAAGVGGAVDVNTTSVPFENNKKIPWFSDGTSRGFPICFLKTWDHTNQDFEESDLVPADLHLDTDRSAIYAPDFFFNDFKNKTSSGLTVYVQEILKATVSGRLVKPISSSGNTDISPMYAIEYGVGIQAEYLPLAYKSAVIHYVQDGVFSGPADFTSLVRSKFSSGGSDWLIWEAVTGFDYVGNAGHIFGKYLGLVNQTGLNIDEGTIVNILNTQDQLSLFSGTLASLSLSTIPYSSISSIVRMDLLVDEYHLFKGDCFLQRFYFRQSKIWDLQNQFKDDLWDDFNSYYRGGLLVSVILETEYNLAMRNEVEYLDALGNLKWMHTYYPKLLTTTTLHSFTSDPTHSQTEIEARSINPGFNILRNPLVRMGYNVNNDYFINKRPTRIYFSEKSKSGEKRDSLRRIGSASYQDYALENRAIIALHNMRESLVSIQEQSIQRHQLGQSQMQAEGGVDIVLQNQGVYLSPKVIPLATFGSQHRQSVIAIGEQVFGVDFRKRIIWGVMAKQNEYTGNSNFSAINLSETTEIQGWVVKNFDLFDRANDIKETLGENPVNGNGIVCGYNIRFKEVNFTLLYKKLVSVTSINTANVYTDVPPGMYYLPGDIVSHNGDLYKFVGLGYDDSIKVPGSLPAVDIWELIYFDEYKIFGHSSTIKVGDLVLYSDNNYCRKYVSRMNNPTSILDFKRIVDSNAKTGYENYVEATCIYEKSNRTIVFDNMLKAFIGEMPYHPSMYLELGNNMLTIANDMEPIGQEKVFLHDNPDSDVGVFYGVKHDGHISIVIAGDKEREIEKLFKSYIIESNINEFSKIEFFTDYGSSNIDPFIPIDANLFYIKPEYLEGMWRGPVRENENETELYNVDSDMRGTWLKITLWYNGNDDQYIRKFVTSFITSSI